MIGVLCVQLEALKATTDTKEVSFKIAYGLPISEMLRWGLYISGAACCLLHAACPCMTGQAHHAEVSLGCYPRLCACRCHLLDALGMPTIRVYVAGTPQHEGAT